VTPDKQKELRFFTQKAEENYDLKNLQTVILKYMIKKLNAKSTTTKRYRK
jgi:hypothetical protein